MRYIGPGAVLAALCLAPLAVADDGPKDAPKKAATTYDVPYRLTVPKHILLRAKINGKGPFNFIMDTGAPALFVSTKACEKLGIKPDKNGWGTFENFEIEGGVVVKNARGRIEDPFQLEGMNGLGLAGAELHGVIGYNVLAKYKMEIDLTSDKMKWTEIDWEPAAPKGIGGGGGAGGLEMMGSLMKMVGALRGSKATPDTTTRGFLGVELVEKGDHLEVKSVMEKSPAAEAGVKAGDKLTKWDGRTVESLEDLYRFANKVTPGKPVKVTVERGAEKKELKLKTGEGL
jgi:hypothetical protein